MAVDDAAVTNEEAAVRINVLANDSDPDGDALTTSAYLGPSKGMMVHNSDQSFTYTPSLNLYGSDSFLYKVTDSTGRTALAMISITITPVDDPPVATADSYTLAEDTPTILSVRLNDKEFDGDRCRSSR